MMESKAQIRNAHGNQCELLIEELHLCGITVDQKEKITEIKKQLIDYECD